jgi:hypothetical protein
LAVGAQEAYCYSCLQMSWTKKRRILESWTKLDVTPLLSGTVRDIEWEFDGAYSVVLAEDPNGNKTGSSATVNMNRRYANELETGEACRLYSQICTIWACETAQRQVATRRFRSLVG